MHARTHPESCDNRGNIPYALQIIDWFKEQLDAHGHQVYVLHHGEVRTRLSLPPPRSWMCGVVPISRAFYRASAIAPTVRAHASCASALLRPGYSSRTLFPSSFPTHVRTKPY